MLMLKAMVSSPRREMRMAVILMDLVVELSLREGPRMMHKVETTIASIAIRLI